MNPAIIIPCFNRLNSLKRLVNSLLQARYKKVKAPLVFVLDKDEKVTQNAIIEYLNQIAWPYGEKVIIQHENNIGLTQNIKYCAALSHQYQSVIVLEDDLFVAPNFYLFAQKVLKDLTHQPKVAGISLNNFSRSRIDGSIRTFAGQYHHYRQSTATWGQIFTSKQWSDFENWWQIHQNLQADDKMPKVVQAFGNWEFEHNLYLIETDKYILYPNEAFSTNFSDPGVHHKTAIDSNYFQVPLSESDIENFKFQNIDECKAVYDPYWEPLLHKQIEEIEGIKTQNINIDLYGLKPLSILNKPYTLTCKHCTHKIASYSNALRDIEQNILLNVSGNEIFLCKTEDIKSDQLSWKQRAKSYFSNNVDLGFKKYLFYKILKYVERKR